MLRKVVIVVAGGSGSRMKSAIPKQFLPIHGKAILIHTIEQFLSCFPDIQVILVLPQGEEDRWEKICQEANFNAEVTLAQGGANRFESVKSGLSKVEGDAVIGVHDAVRPLASKATIEGAYAAAESYGNGIPVVPPKESLRKLEGDGSIAVNRQDYRIVQTPQCFRADSLRQAYEQDYAPFFTDDASVVEAMGTSIQLVAGNVENIKLTTPEDLQLAEILLKAD